MINLFDTDSYPAGMPGELVAGMVWGWTRPDITEAYPTASYTLKYELSLQVTPFTGISITALKTGDAHVVQITDTSSYTAGQYKWQAIVERDSDNAQVVVDDGFVEIKAKVADSVDSSSWVYQVLVAIRATIKGQASSKVSSYTVKGRTLQSRSLEELLELEREFSKRWKQEQRQSGSELPKRRTLITMRA